MIVSKTKSCMRKAFALLAAGAAALGLAGALAATPVMTAPAYADVQVASSVATGEATEKLMKQFSKMGADGCIDNDTWIAAVAFDVMDESKLIDAESVLAKLAENDSYRSMDAGVLGKYVVVLSAADVDCTKAPIGGKYEDLVSQLKYRIKEAADSGNAVGVYDALCILPVFGSYGYDSAAIGSYLQSMIDEAVKGTSSLFDLWGYGADYVSTGQAVIALQPYARSNKDVASALSKAKDEILASQNADGTWGWGTDDTAYAYYALKLLGVSSSKMAADPIPVLVKKTSEGFSDSWNPKMSASATLLAFAAHTSYLDPQSISGKSSWKVTYGAKPFSLSAKAKTALTYKSSNTKVVSVSSKGTVSVKGAGKATITVLAKAANGYQAATKKVTVTVAKKAQQLKVSTARKAAVRGGYTKAVKLSGNKTARAFTKVSGSKFLTVTDYGKIKVSSKAKRGATYTIKVKVKLRESANYKAAAKIVTLKVKAL